MSQSKADYINMIGAGLAGSGGGLSDCQTWYSSKLFMKCVGSKQHHSIRQQILQNWFVLTLSVEIA